MGVSSGSRARAPHGAAGSVRGPPGKVSERPAARAPGPGPGRTWQVPQVPTGQLIPGGQAAGGGVWVRLQPWDDAELCPENPEESASCAPQLSPAGRLLVQRHGDGLSADRCGSAGGSGLRTRRFGSRFHGLSRSKQPCYRISVYLQEDKAALRYDVFKPMHV